MQNVYVDDGEGKKFAVVDEEGNQLPVKNWDDLLDNYAPVRVKTEDSFQAKHAGEHDRILDKAWSLGCEVLEISSRVTGTKRRLWGLEKGTDLDDANLLRRIDQTTNVHWSKSKKRGLKPPSLQQAADAIGRRGLTHLLGRYNKLLKEGADSLCGALGNGKSWDKAATIFAAVARDSKDRDDFLRRMGMSGKGWPGLPRATFYRRVRTLVNRAAPKYDKPKPAPKTPEYTAWRAGRMQAQEHIWHTSEKVLRKACLEMYQRIHHQGEQKTVR